MFAIFFVLIFSSNVFAPFIKSLKQPTYFKEHQSSLEGHEDDNLSERDCSSENHLDRDGYFFLAQENSDNVSLNYFHPATQDEFCSAQNIYVFFVVSQQRDGEGTKFRLLLRKHQNIESFCVKNMDSYIYDDGECGTKIVERVLTRNLYHQALKTLDKKLISSVINSRFFKFDDESIFAVVLVNNFDSENFFVSNAALQQEKEEFLKSYIASFQKCSELLLNILSDRSNFEKVAELEASLCYREMKENDPSCNQVASDMYSDAVDKIKSTPTEELVGYEESFQAKIACDEMRFAASEFNPFLHVDCANFIEKMEDLFFINPLDNSNYTPKIFNDLRGAVNQFKKLAGQVADFRNIDNSTTVYFVDLNNKQDLLSFIEVNKIDNSALINALMQVQAYFDNGNFSDTAINEITVL